MDKFRVQGPTKLQDEVTISGVKNATPPILFAALLTEGPVEIQSAPRLEDVDTSMKLLSQLSAKAERNGSVYTDTRDVNVFCASYDLVKTMRVSIRALGPLIACFGQGQVSLPSGCTTGARPAGLHISGLEQLDATIKLEEGYVRASVDGRLKGVHIMMDKVSVGAAVTTMCTTTPTKSTTIIENAAREPEIVDTASFLITLGAEISGQGTDCIVIEGVERLGDGVYRVLSDRIEAGTFLVAAAISRDKIICRSAQPDTLGAVLAKLRDAGADIKVGEDWTSLDIHSKRPKAANARTALHPALSTDMQAQFVLLNPVTKGTGLITKTVFENRFMHVLELSHMGVYAEIEDNTVVCHGVKKLSSAQTMAADLRTSTGLVLAGYIAEGTTVTDRICHIDRGYERVEDKLRVSGVNIERVKDR